MHMQTFNSKENNDVYFRFGKKRTKITAHFESLLNNVR